MENLHKKKLYPIIILVLLFIGLVLGLILTKQNQDTRKKAYYPGISAVLTMSSTGLNGSTLPVDLNLSIPNTGVSLVTAELSYDENYLTVSTSNIVHPRFDTLVSAKVLPDANPTTNPGYTTNRKVLRFTLSRFSTNPSDYPSGNFNMAKVTFTAKTTPLTGTTVWYSAPSIVALTDNTDNIITSSPISATYVVSASITPPMSPTPTPSSLTPTLTKTPTPSATRTPTPSSAPTSTPYHYSCVASICQAVQGSGINQCNSNFDCMAPTLSPTKTPTPTLTNTPNPTITGSGISPTRTPTPPMSCATFGSSCKTTHCCKGLSCISDKCVSIFEF